MLNRILVIDDNPAIYEDFCKVLCPSTAPSKALLALTSELFDEQLLTQTVTDYRIEYAQRGQDGARMVKDAMGSDDPFVIAFVDMRMPNGWNGLETISNLWREDPRLQIVLCTAYSDYSWQEIRERLSTRDRFLILKKPFDNIEVQQMVETMINRQEAEAQLLLLDACVSQANELVLITDARPATEGGPRIVYVNDLFSRCTGYARDAVIGKSLGMIFGPNTKPAAIAQIEKAQTTCQPLRTELLISHADHHETWVDLNLSPISNAQDTVTHWLYLQRDISEQKSTLDALTEKEYKVVAAVARNSELPLKGIADQLYISEHTLRNHLASIYEKLGVKNRLELYVFCSKFMDDLNLPNSVQATPQ